MYFAYATRVLEGTLRSLNNVQEHLHQSFYYYLLPSPRTYIPIGHYMISFGMLFSVVLPVRPSSETSFTETSVFIRGDNSRKARTSAGFLGNSFLRTGRVDVILISVDITSSQFSFSSNSFARSFGE